MKPAQQVFANSKITKFLEKQLMINPVKRFSEVEIKDISLDSFVMFLCHHQPARCLRSSSDKWRFAEQHYNLKTCLLSCSTENLEHAPKEH